MAIPSSSLITILRETADRLERGVIYRWAHQGRCNCGQLIQTATGLGEADIYRRAMMKPGEWSEHAVDYCPVSHHPLDDVIDALVEIGFSVDDLRHVEYLSDPDVCRRIKHNTGQLVLDFRNREDVILYFRTWSTMLEQQLEIGEKRPDIESDILPTLNHIAPRIRNAPGRKIPPSVPQQDIIIKQPSLT